MSARAEALARARLANNGRNAANNNMGIRVNSDLHLCEQLLSDLDKARALNAEMLEALAGDDPEAPDVIKPMSWLRSAIDALKDPRELIASDDQDAIDMMIQELEQLHRRGSAAIAKATRVPL